MDYSKEKNDSYIEEYSKITEEANWISSGNIPDKEYQLEDNIKEDYKIKDVLEIQGPEKSIIDEKLKYSPIFLVNEIVKHDASIIAEILIRDEKNEYFMGMMSHYKKHVKNQGSKNG